jgi:Homeodomain-like domain
MTDLQKSYLERLVRRTSVQKNIGLRVEILLEYEKKKPKRQIARELDINVVTVRKWTGRWESRCAEMAEIENNLNKAEDHASANREYEKIILNALADAPRSGTPKCFSAEEVTHLVALSCENLDESGGEIWCRTQKEIAREAVERSIVDGISQSSVCRILKNNGGEAA